MTSKPCLDERITWLAAAIVLLSCVFGRLPMANAVDNSFGNDPSQFKQPTGEVVQTIEEEIQKSKLKLKPPEWMIIGTPIGGWLKNITRFRFKVPRTDGGDKIHHLTLTDSGWGAGLSIAGLYKWLIFNAILYYYPNVNSSKMWGGIFTAQAIIPTPIFIKPTVGMGLAYIGTASELNNFNYSAPDSYQGYPTMGDAHFDTLKVNTRNFMPLPEIGVIIEIPIHSWYVRPYYQYLYEDLRARARTPGGTVKVHRQEDGFREFNIPIKSFDKINTTIYKSHVVGLSAAIDFHHFLRLHSSVYYNISHDLVSARIIGSALFSENFGLTIYFERQAMIMVTNNYVMVGLSFLKLPEVFVNALNEARYGTR